MVPPNTWEVKAGGSWVQGQSPLQGEFICQSELHETLWQNDDDGDDNQSLGDGSVVKVRGLGSQTRP